MCPFFGTLIWKILSFQTFQFKVDEINWSWLRRIKLYVRTYRKLITFPGAEHLPESDQFSEANHFLENDLLPEARPFPGNDHFYNTDYFPKFNHFPETDHFPKTD